MSESLLNSEMLDSYRELASADDPDFFKNYLKIFLEGVPRHVAEIKASIQSGDATALARSAHALKSSCLNVGADAIVERSAKLEVLGKAGTLEGTEELASEVAALCRQMADEIHALPEFRSGSD